MQSRALTVTSVVLGAVGLALLAVEAERAMRSVVIGTLGTVLLFVGLGLTVIAAAMVVISLTISPSDPTPPTASTAPAAPELADESAS